jgi:uncharacterized membrane protein YphA (DoxX/SURF4 family)
MPLLLKGNAARALSPGEGQGIELKTEELPMLPDRLNTPYWLLRVVFGVVPIVAGLDKFTNWLTHWVQYLSPWVNQVMPPTLFLHVVGVIEILAGILVLSRFSRFGALLVSAWLVGVAVTLFSSGRFLDVAVRDLVMAAGAFTLARLDEARARQPGTVSGPATITFGRAHA